MRSLEIIRLIIMELVTCLGTCRLPIDGRAVLEFCQQCRGNREEKMRLTSDDFGAA